MVSAAALEKMGGWRTQTISEDLEMSVQLAMAEVKIWWVPLAITYDEQPLSYEISVKQRRPLDQRHHSDRPSVSACDHGAHDAQAGQRGV